MKEEAIKLFMQELYELSKRHGIWISGCGCCGSPYVFQEECSFTHYSISASGDNLTPERGAS